MIYMCDACFTFIYSIFKKPFVGIRDFSTFQFASMCALYIFYCLRPCDRFYIFGRFCFSSCQGCCNKAGWIIKIAIMPKHMPVEGYAVECIKFSNKFPKGIVATQNDKFI